MAEFKYVKDLIIPAEGIRYVNNPADLGGATKYGISQRAYPSLDIKALTFPQALEIY
jgi:lysozyme family protein